MIEIIKELNIEVSKPNVFQAVVAKQYDMNTRFIKATFVDGKDKITIDPSATVKVVINALRPDGESKGFDGVVNEDGTVTVPLHSWMLELDGTVVCDISVIDIESDDNKKLTTTSFTLKVEKAAFGGSDITSDPQYDVLVALLDAATVAQEALDKSNEANSKYDACVEATANANQAADNANAVREEVEAGGYIESLKELNEGNKFSFWVGTSAEYEAVEGEHSNCLHIITDEDDPIETIADLDDRVTTVESATPIEDLDNQGCFYRMVGGTKEWLNPPMELDVEYCTTERYLGRPVYTKIVCISPLPNNSSVEWPHYIFYNENRTQIYDGRMLRATGWTLSQRTQSMGVLPREEYQWIDNVKTYRWEHISASLWAIFISNNYDATEDGTNEIAHVQLWYTKMAI